MIHPLTIAIALTDLCAAGLLLATALRSIPVIRGWSPGDASARQIDLERRLEAASLLGRTGTVVFVTSSIALLLAITAVLPQIVPGAMCGTGIVEAAKAEWALGLRAAALLSIVGWASLDRLDRAAPHAPLATATAKAVLPAAPLSIWTAYETLRAFGRLSGQGVVDCCASVYAAAETSTTATVEQLAPLNVWLFAGGAAALVVGGFFIGGQRRDVGVGIGGGLCAVVAVWIPLAAEVLIEVLAPYHYEVLAHHCPWCLFRSEHGAVGYLLFGALAVTAFEAVALLTSLLAASKSESIRKAANHRIQAAGRRIALATVVFAVLASAPAISWVIRFGVWL
ncbi:MAG: hypothetical protein AAF449_10520 [Myxococcota bacterium]